MQKLNILGLGCFLALIGAVANADLILDNQTVITDVSGISVSPTSGDIFLTTTSKSYTVTSDNSQPPSDSVKINFFTASSPINAGDATSLSWSTSNADSCTATGNAPNWNGTQAKNSSNLQLVIADEGNYSVGLRCTGTDGPVTESRTVIVEAKEPDPVNCGSTPLQGSIRTWRNFWTVTFPGPVSDSELMSVPIEGYQALKFNTADFIDDGKITSIETTATIGLRLGSISQCPGDFDVERECMHIWGLGGGIRWATNGRGGACQLLPNTDYYFNITYTDGFNSSTTSCKVAPCYTTLQHSNR